MFFIIRRDPSDLRGVKSLPAPKVEGLEKKERQFYKWLASVIKWQGVEVLVVI